MSHAIRWTIEKITQRLALIESLVYRRQVLLDNFRYFTPDLAQTENGIEILPNSYWGKPFTEFTLKTTFQVPAEWTDVEAIALYLPLGDAGNFSHPEALIYVDGQSYAACDRHHQEILIDPAWADGQIHELTLQGWTGLGDDWNTSLVTKTVMHPCALVEIEKYTREFIICARTALSTAKILDVDDPVRVNLLTALENGFNCLDTREPLNEKFYSSVVTALLTLCSEIRNSGRPLDVSLTATGHAHIDVAWLWTLDQTRKKAARTFHNVLRLMEQFPDYHFTQSQPQLYEYIRQDHPQLFCAIKDRITEGRWEPIGGMWVEADCNLSGAESLARQFLLGRNYFREHFGEEAESPVLWLPDVFGYAWALPQLIKQAGLDYFFTIKLGWNQYNRLPYDSFWWQGLDGTRVLTHFSTAPENGSAYTSTYNAPADPESALFAWKKFQQKEIQKEVFMAYGYGDGGGGPSREMLENLGEMANFPGLPQVRLRSAGAFFRDLEAKSGPELPTWNGELYLEYHRGTYTSQARNKRANRKSEFALHDAEFLASLASLLDSQYKYPAETFNQAWKLVCLNQFHDIIPGSSIGPVYVDSLRQYNEIQGMTDKVRDSALSSLSAQAGGDWLLVNPTSFTRSDVVFLPTGVDISFEREGSELMVQPITGGVLINPGSLPAYSITPITIHPTNNVVEPRTHRHLPNENILENDFLRVEFSPTGDITRIFDKINHREVLPPGLVANQFQAFEDRPKFWDAWDIDIFYDDKLWLAEPASSVQMVESGPLRWTLEVKRHILHSTYTQRITLTHNSARLDFHTQIDWRERHILLKVAFPVDILAPQATYEIQWGNVTRPTHRNTSWDWARFETCAHKWVDLSEGGYGVSLLNNCKYGHDIRDNVIRLTLLRSPTIPDPEADQGQHEFTYSLYPHAGGWEAGTAAEAYCLNDPILVSKVNNKIAPTGTTQALISTSSPNIIIETIKRAEDGKGYIVRLYESQRIRSNVTLTTSFPLERVEKVNLLEEVQQNLDPAGSQVSMFIRPFEILTLRLIFK
jgi:alpha-mannosidase